MKRALCLFTFAAALSTGAFAAEPTAPVAPACPADTAAVVFAADTSAKKPKCPREGILCPALYDPVICSDGVVYSNSCYASVACATGCVPYGDTI
jgi:hypothetical protein